MTPIDDRLPGIQGRGVRRSLRAAGMAALGCCSLLPLAWAAAPISLPAVDAQGRIHLSAAEQAFRGVQLFTVAPTGVEPAGTTPPAVALSAIVRAAPTASGWVVAQLDGRLVPPQEGFPAPGSRIEAGQTLAYLVPTPTLTERSQLLSEQADAERDLAIAQMKLKQFELGHGGRASIMDDPSNPSLLPQLEAEREGGEKRKQVLAQGYGNRSVVFSERDGVLLGGPLVQGRIASTGDPLFERVDLSRLWLDVLGDADVCSANAAQADLQGVTTDGQWLALRCVAAAPVLTAATAVTRLALVEGGAGLTPGTRLAIRLQPATQPACVALPETAFKPADTGWAQVWVRSGVDHFVLRRVPLTYPGTGRRPGQASLAHEVGEGGPLAQRAVGEGETARFRVESQQPQVVAVSSPEAKPCVGRLLPGEQVVMAGLPLPANPPVGQTAGQPVSQPASH